MADQSGQERDHRARHAGGLDQIAEQHEQRHGKQDQVRHALVHAADHDAHRHARRQCQIGEGAEAEGEGDGHAGEDGGGQQHDEEDNQIDVAEPGEDRLQQIERRADQKRQRHRLDDLSHRGDSRQPHQRDQDHQRGTHRQRRGAPCGRDAERRRGDEGFAERELVGRRQDQQQEGGRGRDRQHFDESATARRQRRDQCGHAHVLATAQRHAGAEQAEP